MKTNNTTIEQNGLSYKCEVTEYGVNVQVPGGYMHAKDMEQAREYIAKYYGNTYAADYTETDTPTTDNTPATMNALHTISTHSPHNTINPSYTRNVNPIYYLCSTERHRAPNIKLIQSVN